jgi:hypothetical protein
MRGFDELQRGDVVQCIKRAWVDNMERLKFYPLNPKDGYYWEAGDYGILRTAPEKWKDKLIIELIGIDHGVKETAESLKNNPNTGRLLASTTGVVNPNTWAKFFKVVRLENLKESLDFDRTGPPLKKLGIGAATWEKLKPGDIIQNKKRVHKASDSDRLYFTETEDTDTNENPGKYFTVKTASEMEGYLSVTMYMSSIFRHAVNVGDWVKEPGGTAPGKTELWANKNIEQWNEWFRIIQPSEYEEEYNKP